jgi:hypothetical protein
MRALYEINQDILDCVDMETGEIRCTRCNMNNQCQGKACPFHPASK